MTDKTQAGPEHYFNAIVEASKPRASYGLVANDIARATAGIMSYDLKPTHKSERDRAFNDVAAAYLGGMYGIHYNDQEAKASAGTQLKNTIQRLPDGSEVLLRIYNAMESGEKSAVLHELNQVWKNSAISTKLETLLGEVRNLADGDRMAFYGMLAQANTGIDGYEASPVSVAENTNAAISGLQQRLAVAESQAKTRPLVKH